MSWRDRRSEMARQRKGEAGWQPVARFWLLLLLPAAAALALLFVGTFVGLALSYPGHGRVLFAVGFAGWATLTILLSRSFLRETGLEGSALRVVPHGMALGTVLVVLSGAVVLGEA